MIAPKYWVRLSKVATRDLEVLPRALRKRIEAKMQLLADEPRPAGVKFLQGRLAGLWRLRIGNYRVLYEVRDDLRLVLVQRIRDRREAYR